MSWHPRDNRSTVPPRRSAPVRSLDASALLHLQVARRRKPAFRGSIANPRPSETQVRELGELWPGEYGIENAETGERIFVSTRDGMKN